MYAGRGDLAKLFAALVVGLQPHLWHVGFGGK